MPSVATFARYEPVEPRVHAVVERGEVALETRVVGDGVEQQALLARSHLSELGMNELGQVPTLKLGV